MDVLLYQIIHDKRENQQEEGIIVEGRKDVPMNQRGQCASSPTAWALKARLLVEHANKRASIMIKIE